ncbi:MAG TPA: GNAT family N-acetyltransferase [Luteimonas sp.]|nr:GNAT family N-acetyltransferase [Luteimonas sp.]
MATAPPRVAVAPVTDESEAAVRALQVSPSQVAYVGDVGSNLDNARRDRGSEAMAIRVDGAVAGFYRIDRVVSVVSRWPPGDGCIALRAFLLDVRWQGRGLGVQALHACCDDLGRRHPLARVLALNVHCANVAAVRAYRAAGFIDSGELVNGGSAGPQHLMVRRLDAGGGMGH